MTERITRSPDLKHLQDEGYEIQIDRNHLLIHSVPYLASNKQLAFGILVSNLVLAGDRTAYSTDSDHTVHFVGDFPRAANGNELATFSKAGSQQEIMPGFWTNHTFSAKPPGNYRDYHHKMSTYIKKLRAPLVELGIEADARTFQKIGSMDNSPFHFSDTNSGRSGTTAINDKIAGQKIAILGQGGTGSYVLDFVAKTPVAEIHLFDKDVMLSHNAFRAPGSPSIKQLRQMINKAAYHSEVYSRMHKGIKPHAYNMTESRLTELDPFDFIFLCIDGDNDSNKQKILQYLTSKAIPFVDVGLNMRIHNSSLRGQIRTTLVTSENAAELKEYIPAPIDNPDKKIYHSNAQIAEMNALNACFAVIAWKRHFNIFDSLGRPDHTVFNIRSGKIISYED